MLIKSQLNNAQKKKLKQITKRTQNKNQQDLTALNKYNKKKNNSSISRAAITELSNPDLVYILGGSTTGGLVYVHSYMQTWKQGLHTATYTIRRMLKELVVEQQSLMSIRINQINNLWSQVFKTISKYEQDHGNNIHINSWNDFANYFNSLPALGQSEHLQEILQYKMAMSALNAIKFWDWKGQTLEEFVQKLIGLNFIDNKQAEEILNGKINIKGITKDTEKILKTFMEVNRKSFIGDRSVSDWLGGLDKNSITSQTYSNKKAQMTLKPDAKQLGFIAEHAIKSDKDVIPVELQDEIIQAFIDNQFQIFHSKSKQNSQKAVYHTSISGETHGQRGGLSNKINKADLVITLDLGEAYISIPSSVKLSTQITDIQLKNNITAIKAQDLFTATASSANLDFSKINEHVKSAVYNRHQKDLTALMRYVYTNAGILPSMHLRDLTLFNNSVIYYLSWLELCLEIVGSPTNNQQLAMALESIGTIHNTADILQQLVSITPAQISDFIQVYTSPLDDIIYSGQNAVLSYQNDKRHLISKLWHEHLTYGQRKPDYKLIYGRLFNVLMNYSGLTKKKMPSLSVSYKIKVGNTRKLSI